MLSKKSVKTSVILVISVLILGVSAACVVGGGAPAVDTAATEQAQAFEQTRTALDATASAISASQTEAAAVPPTPAPTEPPAATATPAATNTPEPTATPAGPVVISEDFSSDTGRFKCDKCEIRDGVLAMGPYPATDSFEAYYAICNDCPAVANYKMSVDATFNDGASDRGFGLLLRENDGSFIDVEILTWQYFGVWHFDASLGKNSGSAWDKSYTPGGWVQGGLKAGRQTNHIEVTLTGGTSLRVVMNGRGGRTVELPNGTGKVGLIVGMHSLGVIFDNFTFEEIK
jgi:hypothetical protein